MPRAAPAAGLDVLSRAREPLKPQPPIGPPDLLFEIVDGFTPRGPAHRKSHTSLPASTSDHYTVIRSPAIAIQPNCAWKTTLADGWVAGGFAGRMLGWLEVSRRLPPAEPARQSARFVGCAVGRWSSRPLPNNPGSVPRGRPLDLPLYSADVDNLPLGRFT